MLPRERGRKIKAIPIERKYVRNLRRLRSYKPRTIGTHVIALVSILRGRLYNLLRRKI